MRGRRRMFLKPFKFKIQKFTHGRKEEGAGRRQGRAKTLFRLSELPHFRPARHLTLHLNRVRVVPITALQRFPNVAARSLASPSARPPLARARALPSELSRKWLPISHVQFATTPSDSCIGWTPTNWTDMFTGCT